MNKYPLGRDILVSWSLDLGGQSVNLADCDLCFEYSAAGGTRIVPASDYTIEDNTLSWTFRKEDQHAYGLYGLRLVASSDGVAVAEFRDKAAFEIIHGEAGDEPQSLAMQSTVETEQEQPEPEEPVESDEEHYVSRSPLYVEKVPLGSNLVVNWKLLSAADFDFPLDECELRLFYSAAGSGCQEAEDYELVSDNGYSIQWDFAGDKQVRFGIYSLFLDIYYQGARVATLVREDGFDLVHRKASDILTDRIIDFESVVTTFGGGALFMLTDILNDGYSTVYRSDGSTPAANGDVLQFNGTKWHSVAVGDLDAIQTLARGILGVGDDVVLLSSRVTDAEGNISTLEQTAAGFDLRVADVEGNVSDLQLSSTALSVRMTNAEGDIGSLEVTASRLDTRMTDAEGNIGSLSLYATGLETRISNAEGDVSSLRQTATSLSSTVVSQGRAISVIDQKADSILAQVTTHDGKIATLEVSDRGLHTSVSALGVDLADYQTQTNYAIQHLQEQIDGAIEEWFYNGTPTLLNQPAVNWTTTDEKNNHLGDLYYDKLTGYAYRFMRDDTEDPVIYSWGLVTDTDITTALEHAAHAQATADGKLKMFLLQPTPPYHLGDLWVKSDGTIFKCVNEKEEGGVYAATDWESSDFEAKAVSKANFDVLATAIIGTVAAYDADGKITSATATQFVQSIDNISFSVAKVGSALLPTGINIADKKITIRSNNFVLAGNDQGAPEALTLTYRNNVPYISAANIDVTGIFSAQRILSSQLQMGYWDSATPPVFHVTAGMSGEYYPSTTTTDPDYHLGHGIAAWYGGPMVDLAEHLTDEPIPDHAKTLFRMDGSGYLADRRLYWSDQGDLHILGNVTVDGTNTSETLNNILDFVTSFASWFVVDTTTMTGKTLLRINMGSQQGTGFDGLIFDGFLVTGGDQIIGSGTPGGGGGGSSYLYELLDVSVPHGSSAPNDGDVLAWDNANSVWKNVAPQAGAIYTPGAGISISNANVISLATSGATAGTYRSVTVDAYGRVTAGSDPSTVDSVSLAEGATNGTIHLVVNSTEAADVSVHGLGSLAYKSSLATSDIPDLSGTYLSLTGGTLQSAGEYIFNINNSASGGTNCWQYFKVGGTNKASVGYYYGLAFIANETSLGRIGVNDSGTPQYWPGTSSSAAQTLLHAGNYSNYALPLSGGTMTGQLQIATGYGIEDATGNGMLCYHPSSWTGVSDSQWGVGAIDSQGVIRSSNTNLWHYRNGNGTYVIFDESNANKSDVAWTCSYLTVNASAQTTYRAYVDGVIASSGDQIITSDETKKTNFKDINVSLEQIANAPAVSFDWKDGSGHSFGSIAQYWKPIVPESVLGEEGNYSLAYGQLADILVINLAREVMELREKIERLKVR